MRNLFQKASRLAQILLASSISFLQAEPISTKLHPGETKLNKQEIVLKEGEEEIKQDEITIKANLNQEGNEFTLEYFTKDFNKQNWDEEEKSLPPFVRHLPLSASMRILIHHPETVAVEKTQQEFFVVPGYRWETAIPKEEHKTAQRVDFILEKAPGKLEEICYQIPGLAEATLIVSSAGKLAKKAVTKELEERYGNLFPAREGYDITRINLDLTKRLFGNISTAYRIRVPFRGKVSEDDKVIFWTDPAFGTQATGSNQGTWSIGFARLDPLIYELKLNNNGIDKSAEEKQSANKKKMQGKVMGWYSLQGDEREDLVLDEKETDRIRKEMSTQKEIRVEFKTEVFHIPDQRHNDSASIQIIVQKSDNERELNKISTAIKENFQKDGYLIIRNGNVFVGFIPGRLSFEQESIMVRNIYRYHTRVGGDIESIIFDMDSLRRSKLYPETKGDLNLLMDRLFEVQLGIYQLGKDDAEIFFKKKIREFGGTPSRASARAYFMEVEKEEWGLATINSFGHLRGTYLLPMQIEAMQRRE